MQLELQLWEVIFIGVTTMISLGALLVSYFAFRISAGANQSNRQHTESHTLLAAMNHWLRISEDPQYRHARKFVQLNPDACKGLRHDIQTAFAEQSLLHAEALLKVAKVKPELEWVEKPGFPRTFNIPLDQQEILRKKIVFYCNNLEAICFPLSAGIVNVKHFKSELEHVLNYEGEFVFQNFVTYHTFYPSYRNAYEIIMGEPLDYRET